MSGLFLVQITIGNLKVFLLGTCHGMSVEYLQQYLNESDIDSLIHMGGMELSLGLFSDCFMHIHVNPRIVSRCVKLRISIYIKSFKSGMPNYALLNSYLHKLTTY